VGSGFRIRSIRRVDFAVMRSVEVGRVSVSLIGRVSWVTEKPLLTLGSRMEIDAAGWEIAVTPRERMEIAQKTHVQTNVQSLAVIAFCSEVGDSGRTRGNY